jgi:hypothetical protein
MLTKNTDILRKEVSAHIVSDALVKGSYWKTSNNAVGGKGCFIGCLTHSNDPRIAFERFGLPVEVIRIAENIFEDLPDEEGRAFFAALPDAVGRDGKDLSRVHWAFLAAELRALPKSTDAVKSVIDPVIAGMDLLASGKDWPKKAADAAADAADAAAYASYAADAAAARAAAYAAEAAYAPKTADAADAAAFAAKAAAEAAYATRAARADAAAFAAAEAAYATYAAAYATYVAEAAARASYATAAKAAAYATDARTSTRPRQRDTLLALIAAA